MLTAVAASGGPSPERWVEVRSAHFAVMTDAGEKDGRRIAGQFERMHAVFQRLFPLKDDGSDPPIVVLAVKDRKAMQALEPLAYLGKDKLDLSGLFLWASDQNYILVRLDANEEHPFATVYHEYTHYMLHKAEWLPLWLNEGLAEFYENTDIDEKGARLGQASVEDLNYLNANRMLPLATLFAVDRKSPYYHDESKGSVFYAESWLLTHYLIAGDEALGTHRVHDYAQLLAQGEDPVTAAREAFGDLAELQLLLERYLLQRKFTYFILKEPLATKDPDLQVRAVPEPEANAVRADVLICSERTGDAQALLESLLRADPNDARASEGMGLLSFRKGDYEAARRWYGEAVRLNSQSYLAHYYYAVMALHAGDKQQDEAIESSLRTAMKLAPQFAPSYDTLAAFVASRHRNLDEAEMLAARAIELEPDRLSYRMDAADVLAEERKLVSAVEALKAAQRLAKTPEEIDAVQGRIKRYERYEAFERAREGDGADGPER
jgi:Tfp pilus assembly protein PilF